MARNCSLKELSDATDRWSIVVRVFRKWNVYQKTHPHEIFCISMVLLDAEGMKIQASVINKSVQQRFNETITEGQTYLLANFVVTPNVSQYRATTHPFKLTFTGQTYIMQQAASIPSYSYSFMPITEILKADQDHQVDYLIDVMAYVRTMGTLEEFHRDQEIKMKLRMVLTDTDEHDVDCVLFDECASDAFMAQLQNSETPVVIVLNLARVGFSEDGVPTVYNSFGATRVAFNPPLKEVKNFIDSTRDGFSPTMISMSQPIPTQSSQMSSGNSLHSQPKITISDIPNQEIGASFVVNCEIQKLETRYGWNYDGCGKCGTKATLEKSTLICPSCTRRTKCTIEPKLKLHYLVKDKTGTASIIFWDKLAVQLIEKTASELKLILKEAECDYDFPIELDKPVGKSVLLKLKMNEYNKSHPTSSISVTQYTVCEDLLNQFDEATVETHAGEGNEVHNDVQSTVSVADQTTDPEIVQLVVQSKPSLIEANEETLISDLTNNITPVPVKGKRRINVKRNAVRDEQGSASQRPTVTPPEEKVTKVIKQEK